MPQFLYKDAEFSKVQGALNWEHEHLRLKLIELARQGFIQTADRQGLLDWAKFLKIQPRDDTEYLRNLIAQKRLGGRVLTPERFIELMNSFLVRGHTFYNELGGNQIEIGFNNGTPQNWDDFWAALLEFLPAHIGLFAMNIEWHLDPHDLYLAQLQLNQGGTLYDLSNRLSGRQKLYRYQGAVTAGRTKFDIDTHSHTTHTVHLRTGVRHLIHGRIHFDSEDDLPDEETLIDFERYLRRRWAEFKKNAVVKHYGHYFDDMEIENPDDEEDFPYGQDFLRLYFDFEGTAVLRTLTLLQPRKDIQGAEVNALSLISHNLLMSRRRLLSSRIVKAVYVEKEVLKIL